jgi:hypothetical protein
VAALLLSSRAGESQALAAWRALAERGLDAPRALAAASPETLRPLLADLGLPHPERLAPLLVRASRSLDERHAGSLEQLADEAWDLAALGSALTGLSPGLGAATALRFLRPLRERWPAAREVPLAAPARAAAIHLGWIALDADAEGEPGALAAFLRNADPEVASSDAEAALERLGAAACARERVARCPLGAACPARATAAPA